MMFIFENEIKNKFSKNQVDDFEFEPYTYGPFSKKVCEAIDFLAARNLINISTDQKTFSYESQDDADLDRLIYSSDENNSSLNENDVPGYFYEEFSLTPDGKKMMKNGENALWFSWGKLTPIQQNILIKFKTNMIDSRLKDILKYVYRKYPKFAEKSVIKNELFSYGI